MSDYNWCHGPQCHTYSTQDRVRGIKGNKVLRTRKVKITEYNRNGGWQYFCSQGCWNDFFHKYANECRNIAPRNEPLETPINVTTKTYTNWRGDEYQAKEIETINNNEGETMSQN
jgi:YHS domain-containing protein